MCCRVLQVLHWLAVYCSVWLAGTCLSCHKYELVRMLQCLALCCSASQCVTVCWSCHTWMSHMTYMNESCHASEWVMSHIWMILVTHRMRYVTQMNESCHISHIRHMQESRHAFDWVMSHILMSHVINMDESCQTNDQYDWVILHIRRYEYGIPHNWRSHVTHLRESWYTHTHVSSNLLVKMHL